MSEFNARAKAVNEIAKDYFRRYKAAKIAHDVALDAYSHNHKPEYGAWHTDAAEMAKFAKIEADYLKAKADLVYIEQTVADEARKKIAQERKQLVADTNAAFLANPTKIDPATMTLLNSGILSAEEYIHLMDGAERDKNYTMMRLIGHAAETARESIGEVNAEINPGKHKEAVLLSGVMKRGYDAGPGRYLEDFDNAVYIFERSVRTPQLGDKWEEFTKNFVDNF